MKGPFTPSELDWRGRVRFAAHLFKARFKQHHTELLPILAPLVPAEAVVIDVGGHAGQFAKLFARMAPKGRVYSFEPGSYARAILAPAVAHIPNIEVVPLGLGATAGQATLSMPIKKTGSYGFGLSHIGAGPGQFRSEDVAITTLDGFAAERALTRVDFIKADIEGFELQMLKGATATLARFRPTLLIEATDAHLARPGDSLQTLWDFITQAGYTIHRLSQESTPRLDPCEGPVEGDLLCRPR